MGECLYFCLIIREEEEGEVVRAYLRRAMRTACLKVVLRIYRPNLACYL